MWKLKFDAADARLAHEAWGCNCGPAALAAITGKTLDQIRPFMGPFEQRFYTNISNMSEAIAAAGMRIRRSYKSWPVAGMGIVRIQFGGPWIINGKPARWAARATHWIATYRDRESNLFVFDVNGGIMDAATWEANVIPRIAANIKRADGTWSITHGWEVVQAQEAIA